MNVEGKLLCALLTYSNLKVDSVYTAHRQNSSLKYYMSQ